MYPHPALRYVQIPEQGRGLVPRGREPQLHQQLGAVQRHRHQRETSEHRQNLEQEQEEQGQGVLRVIVRALVFCWTNLNVSRKRQIRTSTCVQYNNKDEHYLVIFSYKTML